MKCLTNAGTRTEAQRGLKIFDRAVGLPCPISQHPADKPHPRRIRIERQRPVDQRHHGADVLAEPGQRLGGIHQNARVVFGCFERPPGEIGRLPTVSFSIFTQPVIDQTKTTGCSQGECGAVTWIAVDRLL